MPEAPKEFKSQPWILFDTIASKSFLLGDVANGKAIGSEAPAITAAGDIIFFNGGARNNAQTPWYTNLQLPGQLAYGMEVWQIYVAFAFPAVTPAANNGYDSLQNPGVPPTTKLMEAILNFGVLELNLGQEEQTSWPLTRFGAGGGLAGSNSLAVVINQNSIPQGANVMKLAEAIEMPRTQNLSAKIKIASEAHAIIGTPALPGVGQELAPYVYHTNVNTFVALDQLPFSIQLGLVGRRVKKTQYGQVPGGVDPGAQAAA